MRDQARLASERFDKIFTVYAVSIRRTRNDTTNYAQFYPERMTRKRDAIRRGRGLRTYQLGAGSTEPIGASADHLQCRCPEAGQLLTATIKMELPRGVGKRCRGRCRAWAVRRQERASHTPRPLTRVLPILLHARFNERESVELSSDTRRVLRSTMEWTLTLI